MMHASLSRKILVTLIGLVILSWLGPIGAMVARATALVPSLVYPGWELWRLLTYPLAVGFVSAIVAGICFSAPAEEIEQMLGTRRFGLLLLGFILGCGIVHTLAFWGESSTLSGPMNLALFVLVGFVYLFPHSEIRLIFFSVRGWVLLTFIAATVVFISLFRFVEGESLMGLFGGGGYGLLLGAAYFHIRFQKYAVLLRPIRSVERMMAGGAKRGEPEWRGTPASRRSVQQPVRLRMPFQKSAPRELSDEERLNAILDRINEKGYSDLSEEEKQFLKEYSGRLS